MLKYFICLAFKVVQTTSLWEILLRSNAVKNNTTIKTLSFTIKLAKLNGYASAVFMIGLTGTQKLDWAESHFKIIAYTMQIK